MKETHLSEDEGDTSMETSFSSTFSQVEQNSLRSTTTSSVDIFSNIGTAYGREVVNNLLDNQDYEGADYLQKITKNLQNIENSKNSILFTTVEGDGSIAGFLICSNREKSRFNDCKSDCISFFVTIDAIRVSTEKRRQGIGSDLVKDFEREMVALSQSFLIENDFVKTVVVQIKCKSLDESNEFVNFWEKQGFYREDQYPQNLFKSLKCTRSQILDRNEAVISYLHIPREVLPIQKVRAGNYISSVKNHGGSYTVAPKDFNSLRKERIQAFQTW